MATPARNTICLWFDGDAERRRSEALGPFAYVRRVEEHALHGPLAKLRLRLKTTLDRFEPITRQGLEASRNTGAAE